MTTSGPSPGAVLIAAVVVLLAGIAALAVHDDKRTPTRSTGAPSTVPTTTLTTTTTGADGSTTTSQSASTTASSVATTVRPPVTSPEAAVNGLWAAYAANNQIAAQRFGTEDVIHVLFEAPYDGQQGMFQGCRRNNDAFDCVYLQPSTRYAMTVKPDAANGFLVVALTVSPS